MEKVTINGKEYQIDIDKCKEQGLLKEEKNILDGAKFGDVFLTKLHKKAVYVPIGNSHYCQVEGYFEAFPYSRDGKCIGILMPRSLIEDSTIVAKYVKTIDEEKLEKLAIEHSKEIQYKATSTPEAERYWSFKAGYRKAKEE